jgi:hypothetical protein
VISLSDRDDVLSEGSVKLSWEYATDQANDGQERDRDVDRAVARTFAARARQEAVGNNRVGDFAGCPAGVMEATARRIRKYAGRDADLRQVVEDLEGDVNRFALPMAAPALKQAYASTNYALRSRAPDGKAMKTPSGQA